MIRMRTQQLGALRVQQRAQRRARHAGFTLVELMIALVLGGIAIGAMYQIGSVTTRQFQQQHQVGTTQGALRFAMNQVKRDIARAGYQATPMASLPGQAACGPLNAAMHSSAVAGGEGWIAGISAFRNNVVDGGGFNPAVDPQGLNTVNGFTADELVLLGNYETANEYPGVEVVNAQQIALDVDPTGTWHSIFQDFAWAPDGTPAATVQEAAVRAVFTPNRLIRIQGRTGVRHFARIAGGNAVTIVGNTLTISFVEPLLGNCSDAMTGGWVAPLSFIRYGAQTGVGEEAERFDQDESNDTIGHLVRTEADPLARTTPYNNNIRSVLAYLVAFNLEFTMSGPNLDTGQPDNYVIGTRTFDPTVVNPSPQRVRAVQVTLAARLPQEDPTFPAGEFPASCDRMRCYKIWPTTMTGSVARVRFLRSEVFVPNIAFEGY